MGDKMVVKFDRLKFEPKIRKIRRQKLEIRWFDTKGHDIKGHFEIRIVKFSSVRGPKQKLMEKPFNFPIFYFIFYICAPAPKIAPLPSFNNNKRIKKSKKGDESRRTKASRTAIHPSREVV